MFSVDIIAAPSAGSCWRAHCGRRSWRPADCHRFRSSPRPQPVEAGQRGASRGLRPLRPRLGSSLRAPPASRGASRSSVRAGSSKPNRASTRAHGCQPCPSWTRSEPSCGRSSASRSQCGRGARCWRVSRPFRRAAANAAGGARDRSGGPPGGWIIPAQSPDAQDTGRRVCRTPNHRRGFGDNV
jgi:hypothetical protein